MFSNLDNYVGRDNIAPFCARVLGAKFLVLFSSRSLKTREKYISFAQFVYFLNDKIHNYVKKTNIIVNFVIQKFKSKCTSFKKYTN